MKASKLKRWLVAALVACAGILSANAGANFAYDEKEFSLLPSEEDFVWDEKEFSLLPPEEDFVWDEKTFWLMPDGQDRTQEALEDIFDVRNTPTTVEPVYNEDGNLTGHKVTLGRDYESLALATDLGDVMIDLNGWTISGTNGVNGTTTAGGKGGAAIVVAGECGSDTGATAITVTNIPPVCVQLWENGPYFAQCNVGATKPEESGYYFWWGDTVGYTNSGSAWVSADGNGTIIRFDENESPANSTYKKTVAELYDNGNGYIDANSAEGKLKPEHDAATVHLGAPWRMMTNAELQKLVDTDIATRVCTSVWTTCNGVDGRRVFGITPGHEGLSIFLPATGFGSFTYILSRWSGSYWSSLPKDKTSAWSIGFDSDDFSRSYGDRYFGHSVRPVRDSAYADGRPVSGPAAAIVGGNGGDGNPAGKGSPAVVDESGAAVAVDDPMGLVKNGTDGINRAAEWVLREIFGEPSVVNTVVVNGIAAYTKVTLGQDYGPLAFSTDLGAVTLDLNGWTIRGTNGVNGTATTAGGNGGAAITIAGTCGAAAGTTAITVINNGATDGVQLWEGGPYFAECNVGANAPHEYGYYFWWGDTVGYTNRGSAWVSADGKGKTIKFSSTDTTANQTYGKDDDTLKSEGWIDESGNLVAAHDAATAHLGAPWRMMTDAELETLVDEDVCQCTWTGNWEGTGKKGYVTKGKTAGYTDKSVFFPAAGCGEGSNLSDESCGFYWSLATSSKFAWYLWFDWEDFMRLDSYRYYGFSVRPVRGFDTGRPAVGPAAAIIGGNGGDGNPAGKGAPAIVDGTGAAVAVTDPKGAASGSGRVLRGGCWINLAQYCRSALRNSHFPSDVDNIFGFRLCCSVDDNFEIIDIATLFYILGGKYDNAKVLLQIADGGSEAGGGSFGGDNEYLISKDDLQAAYEQYSENSSEGKFVRCFYDGNDVTLLFEAVAHVGSAWGQSSNKYMDFSEMVDYFKLPRRNLDTASISLDFIIAKKHALDEAAKDEIH